MILLLTEGQVSDYRGAATVLPALPDADVLIADRGYDSDWFRAALAGQGIVPCIPGRKNRKQAIEYDAGLYKQRNHIERMFGRLKDWRRIATRYDRCAHTFMSAICIAATVILVGPHTFPGCEFDPLPRGQPPPRVFPLTTRHGCRRCSWGTLPTGGSRSEVAVRERWHCSRPDARRIPSLRHFLYAKLSTRPCGPEPARS